MSSVVGECGEECSVALTDDNGTMTMVVDGSHELLIHYVCGVRDDG